MKLSQLKDILSTLVDVRFRLPDNSWVPDHCHVTEVGLVTRHFIDCGGTIRQDQVVNLQLWHAGDYEHRLKPQKLLHIIRLSEEKLNIPDLEIEVEYQGSTIGRYRLAFNHTHFVLESTQTACLAEDACGLPGSAISNHLPNRSPSSCCSSGAC